MTAADVMVMLSKRFCVPEWAFLAGARNATGYGASRTADAMACRKPSTT